MTIAPKFYKSHVFPQITTPAHTVELYLDYACPFSGKLYKKWFTEIYPAVESKYNGKIKIVFKNYVQPWHPTSTLLHEAGIVVARFEPEQFLKFSYDLFDHIEEFYDSETFEETRNETYLKIYNNVIAKGSYSISKEDFLGALNIKKSEKPSNGGNAATDDLKYFTKVGRQNGIHVTPTVVINGFKDSSIESSTSVEEILKKFDALV